jgi:hypothetical protein
MCGIVGLFAKTPEVEANLGALLAPMLHIAAPLPRARPS